MQRKSNLSCEYWKHTPLPAPERGAVPFVARSTMIMNIAELANYPAIVDLTVLEGMVNIWKDVIRVEHAPIAKGVYASKEVLFRK